MGVVINIATCVLLMAFSPTSAEIDCEKDAHDNCPNVLYDTVSDNFESFSEAFLVKRCSDILEEVSCTDNYIRACHPDNYKIAGLLSNGMKNMFTELCNETSDLRIGFRQHTDCFQRKSSKLRRCKFIAMETEQRHYTSGAALIRGPRPYASDPSELQKMALLCRFQESFRSCSFMVAKNSCGEDAAQYLSTVYEKRVQGWVSEIC